MHSENSHSYPCHPVCPISPFSPPRIAIFFSCFSISLGFIYGKKYNENIESFFFFLLNISGKSYENMLPGPTFKSVLLPAIYGAFPTAQKNFFSIFLQG